MINLVKNVAEVTLALTLAVIVFPVGVLAFLLLWAVDLHRYWRHRRHCKKQGCCPRKIDDDRLTVSKIF